MNVSLMPELEKFVEGKVESGLYNNASEVIREGLRLLKEHDEVRVKWREQIERGWLQAQAGQVVDDEKVFQGRRPHQATQTQARLMASRFIFTEEAETQFLEILDHLADESESATVRVRDTVYDVVGKLAESPGIGQRAKI